MAKNILRKLNPDEFFYLHNGKKIKSVKAFPKKLRKLDDKTFTYHHNPETNDFANWFRYLSDDSDFISKVEQAQTKQELARVVDGYINSVSDVSKAIKSASQKPKKKKAGQQKKAAPEPSAPEKNQEKNKEPSSFRTEWITAGIREYLLGVITGIIIGLIIGSMV